MAKQTIRGKHNLQVGGDFIVSLSQALNDINKIGDIDQAIFRVGNTLDSARKRYNNFDGLRIMLWFICLLPLLGTFLGALLVDMSLLLSSCSVTMFFSFFVGKVRGRLHDIKIQIDACQAIMGELWKQKILLQATGIQHASCDS